jgi:hypothetical protein
MFVCSSHHGSIAATIKIAVAIGSVTPIQTGRVRFRIACEELSSEGTQEPSLRSAQLKAPLRHLQNQYPKTVLASLPAKLRKRNLVGVLCLQYFKFA